MPQDDFLFKSLRYRNKNKALQTVNKFITNDIIFVQKALFRLYPCVFSLKQENIYIPLAATSRGIFELNPFSILISGGNMSQQSMGLHSFENNGKSTVHRARMQPIL